MFGVNELSVRTALIQVIRIDSLQLLQEVKELAQYYK